MTLPTYKHKIISLEAYRWARLRLNYYFRTRIENEPSRNLPLSSFLERVYKDRGSFIAFKLA